MRKSIDEAIHQEDLAISEKMIDHIIAELRQKALEYRESQMLKVYNGDVVKVDEVLQPELHNSMLSAVELLRDELRNDDAYRDFFEKPERALIDPYLWPLVYGKSWIVGDREIELETCIHQIGKGRIITATPLWERLTREIEGFSYLFQLLPCDLKVNSEGKLR